MITHIDITVKLYVKDRQDDEELTDYGKYNKFVSDVNKLIDNKTIIKFTEEMMGNGKADVLPSTNIYFDLSYCNIKVEVRKNNRHELQYVEVNDKQYKSYYQALQAVDIELFKIVK